jgi:ribose transport system substrate-binding protein
MKRLRVGLTVLAVVSLTLAGCSSTGSSAAPASSGGTGSANFSNEEYIFVSSMGNLEYFNAVKYGWKWAGQVVGVKTTYTGPAENDINAQAAAFEQAIAKKPKGIVVFAYDPVIQPMIDKASDAGIPVVTAIGDMPSSKRIAYVGSSQHDLGYLGGMSLGTAINGQGQVAILSLPGTAMFDDREKGYRDALATFPGIKVVQTGDTKADTVTAVSVAKSIMQRFPDLAGFAGTDSTAGIGAATAVKEAGMSGKVKVIAMDRNSDVLQMVKDGTITGTIAQEDTGIPYWALLVLFNYVHNPSPLARDPVKAGVISGANNISMHPNYIDQSNVQYFLDMNETFKK